MQTAIDPYIMLYGHFSCLHPCWVPANPAATVIQCPLSSVESSVDYPELELHVPSPSTPVCPGCLRLSEALQFCQHCTLKVCPACNNLHRAEVLAHLTEKLTTLRSDRTALASLKATLSKLKSTNGSCKERLHCWVTLATAQLHCSADCALEAANRTLVLISDEEEARLKKLEEDLRKLQSRQAAQGQVADDVRQGKMYIDLSSLGEPKQKLQRKQRKLKEAAKLFKKSGITTVPIAHESEMMSVVLERLGPATRSLQRRIRKLDESLELFQWSGNTTQKIAQKFEMIQLQLQYFRLLIPESEDWQYMKQSRSLTRRVTATLTTNDIGLETREPDNDTFILTSNKPTIFVGQLNLSTTSADLKAYFAKFGTIASAGIVTDASTHKSRGYGFITFADRKALEGGLLDLCHVLDGYRLSIKPAIFRDSLFASIAEPQVQCENSREENLYSNRIRVSNLPATTQDHDLYDYFSRFGLITKVSVRKNKKKTKGRGSARHGVVVFHDPQSAKLVFDARPHILRGTKISVSVARKNKSDGEHTRCENSREENLHSKRILVTKLPAKTEDCDLFEYFSRFGLIKMVSVRKKKGRRSARRGLVVFHDMVSAKIVFAAQPHILNGAKIGVSAAGKNQGDDEDIRCENSREDNLHSKRILVANLPATTEDCDLFEYFSRFGLITEVFVRKKQKGPNSARCGVVVFRDTDSAKKMFDAQPHILNGTKISVLATKKNKSDNENATSHTKLDIPYEYTFPTFCNRTTIFVARLTPITTEADLEVYFSKFDTVHRAKVITDRTTGLSRGFGFVTFVDKRVLESGLLEACHFINGSRLNVKPARPRTPCLPSKDLIAEDIQSSTNCL